MEYAVLHDGDRIVRTTIATKRGVPIVSVAPQPEFLVPVQVAATATEAVGALKRVSSRGNAVARFLLGACYEDGRGVHRSPAEARRLWTLSLEEGVAKAAVRLARQASVSTIDARELWTRAADAGDPEACLELADLYPDDRLQFLYRAAEVRPSSSAADMILQLLDESRAEAMYRIGVHLMATAAKVGGRRCRLPKTKREVCGRRLILFASTVGNPNARRFARTLGVDARCCMDMVSPDMWLSAMRGNASDLYDIAMMIGVGGELETCPGLSRALLGTLTTKQCVDVAHRVIGAGKGMRLMLEWFMQTFHSLELETMDHLTSKKYVRLVSLLADRKCK